MIWHFHIHLGCDCCYCAISADTASTRCLDPASAKWEENGARRMTEKTLLANAKFVNKYVVSVC